jgi:hypothetical protein
MKVAIYVEDGWTQLVLTPENEWEKSVTKAVSEGPQPAQIKRGSFYQCQGGWVRQGSDDESLMLVVGAKPVEQPRPRDPSL